MYIYTDGASRGNGGESASSFIIVDKNNIELQRGVRNIGLATNNMAEYMAVHDALQYCYLNVILEPSITIVSDSTLVINQLKGIWRINNNNLKEINRNIRFYINNMNASFTYEWVSRTHSMIALCDKMNNQCLDSISLIT
jgi:ribonuclease HI